MNKIFLVLIAAAALMLAIGCFSTGKVDWDIHTERLMPSYNLEVINNG